MADSANYRVKFRRRRQKKTNYPRRLGYLKSGKPRLVVRLSNKHCNCQVVVYGEEGDRTVAHATSQELSEFGYKGSTGNIPAAYLTGLLCATRSKKKEAVLDIGLRTPKKGTRIFAALKGALDGGMKINHGDVLPSEERLYGSHTDKTDEKEIKAAAEKIKKGSKKTKPKSKKKVKKGGG